MENLGIGTWIHRRRVKSVGKVAMIAGDRTTTYDAFAERVDRLAAALIGVGVAPGDRIAYLGPNAPEFLETLFAAGTAAGVFVPLNTRLAAPEIRYALDDSGASLVVVAPELEHLVVDADLPRIVIGAPYEAMLAGADPTHLDLHVDIDDPAVILYTSGTTGRPKGAVLTHSNLIWNTVNVLVDYDVTSTEVALLISPLFHAASLGMGALPALLKGGTVVLQARFDPEEALRAIAQHRVTSLSGVPTTFQLIAEHPDWGLTDISSLTKITCGGSPVPARVAHAYEQRGLAFSGGYGMTEASPGATSLSSSRSQDRGHTAGLPHFFTDVRVVTDDGHLAQAGEVGEIQVAGPNVIERYWNLDTADAFEGKWFRSGDLGVVDEEGFLSIADRLKDMIISGGENVYPAELEQILMERSDVAAVAVIAVPHEKWGEVGRAIVVPADGATPSEAELLAYFDGRVARYKTPKSVILVDDLPRTASGKPKKAELRDRYGAPTP